jgi:CheY-like chemotaxis protein
MRRPMCRPTAPGSRTLLLVDDEPRLLSSLYELLRGRDYKLVTASTGTEAIAHLSRLRFDLVLLDLRLPDIGGHEIMDFINAKGLGAERDRDERRGRDRGRHRRPEARRLRLPAQALCARRTAQDRGQRAQAAPPGSQPRHRDPAGKLGKDVPLPGRFLAGHRLHAEPRRPLHLHQRPRLHAARLQARRIDRPALLDPGARGRHGARALRVQRAPRRRARLAQRRAAPEVQYRLDPGTHLQQHPDDDLAERDRHARARPGSAQAGILRHLRRRARHHRPQARGRGDLLPGLPRHPDRPAEPHPVQGPPRPGRHPGQAQADRARGDVHRPGPLQAGQRHPRPREGRRAAQAGRRAPEGMPAQGRYAGAPGRRRIHHRAARAARPRRRQRRGRQVPRMPAPALRPGRPRSAHLGLDRHRGLPDPRRIDRRTAAPRRHRHVPGQGTGQERPRLLRPVDAGSLAPEDRAGTEPAPRARTRRTGNVLPAADRPDRRPHRRRRGADALEPPDPRRRVARRVPALSPKRTA